MTATAKALAAGHRTGTSLQRNRRRTYQRIEDAADPAIFITLRDKANRPGRRRGAGAPGPAAFRRSGRGEGQYRRRRPADDRRLSRLRIHARTGRNRCRPAQGGRRADHRQDQSGPVRDRPCGRAIALRHTAQCASPDLIPGGSSSGSAVAVAQGIVPLALGTDTAGSGRVPAGLNNIVGLKPSLGLVSAAGVVPACRTLDCVSIFALTVADAFGARRRSQAMMRVTPSRGAGARRDVGGAGGLRIGVPRQADRDFLGSSAAAVGLCRAARRSGWAGGEPGGDRFPALLWTWRGCFTRDLGSRSEPPLSVTSLRAIRTPSTRSPRRSFRRPADPPSMRSRAYTGCESWAEPRSRLSPKSTCSWCPPCRRRDAAQLEADPIGLNTRLGAYTNFVNLLDLAGIAVPATLDADSWPTGVTLSRPPRVMQSLPASAPPSTPAPG